MSKILIWKDKVFFGMTLQESTEVKISPVKWVGIIDGLALLPSARMRGEGTVVVSVCLSVCYSTSHFSNVCSSHDLLNGQRRSSNGFL